MEFGGNMNTTCHLQNAYWLETFKWCPTSTRARGKSLVIRLVRNGRAWELWRSVAWQALRFHIFGLGLISDDLTGPQWEKSRCTWDQPCTRRLRECPGPGCARDFSGPRRKNLILEGGGHGRICPWSSRKPRVLPKTMFQQIVSIDEQPCKSSRQSRFKSSCFDIFNRQMFSFLCEMLTVVSD
jgi:hypothetical protein